jgi:hypothetical protein
VNSAEEKFGAGRIGSIFARIVVREIKVNKMEGRFISEDCKHIMRICPKCGATFCKGECKDWTEAGKFSYDLGNALSRHKNHIPYEEITEEEICDFCQS